MITLKEAEEAYNRLSMIHSETMLENIELRKQLERMSHSWKAQFVFWLKVKLGLIRWYE